MRIHWYWPWPFHRAMALAQAVIHDGDHLTLQTLRSRYDPAVVPSPSGVRLVPDLPEPAELREYSPRWALDRTAVLLGRARRREALVRREEFDVSHVHLLNALVDPAALPRLRRLAPIVSTVHDVFPHHRRLPKPVERLGLRRIYETGGALVVYHQHLRSLLVERFEVPADRVTVIPHPIRRFQGDEHRPTASVRRVLFFGAIRRNKGIESLLRAIRLATDLHDVEFVFAGRGVATLERAVAQAAGDDPRITAYLRYITDAERDDLYLASDLVVLPYSEFASQSGVLADAYSYGVPLLVTDVGALGDTVREDRTGWVVAPRDPLALSEGIRVALDDAAKAAEIRRRMATIARDRSEPRTALAFRHLYDSVVR